jgi:hypothetical protein
MFKHAPQFDVKKIIKHYEEKDGVPITYVCTSDLTASDIPMDIFYRDTPHPQFGNKYFGLYIHPVTDHLMITNADKIESLDFGMIEDKDGNLWYSQSHHDCLFVDDQMIDGGRAYIRSAGPVQFFKVKDGKLIKVEE